MAQQRASPAPTLSRGPPGLDRQQPDLHHHHCFGTPDHRGLGRLHCVPDVCQVSGCAAKMAHREPDPRQHCPPGTGLPDPVFRQGQQARYCRLSHFVDHRSDPDLHHRPHAQWHLARAPAAPVCPARAGLLGRTHARAGAAWPELERHFLCAVCLARDRGRAARWPGAAARCGAIFVDGLGHGGHVLLHSQHPSALGPCLDWRPVCIRRL